MTPRASAKVWPRNGTPNDPGAVGILRSPQRMRPLRASLQRKVQRFGQNATRVAHASAPQGDVRGGQQQQGIRRQLRARFRGDHRATGLPKGRRPSKRRRKRGGLQQRRGPGRHPAWSDARASGCRRTPAVFVVRQGKSVRLRRACFFATSARGGALRSRPGCARSAIS